MSAPPERAHPPGDRVESFGLTDQGKVREHNEDHFVTARLDGDEAHLFVVADGVGGRPYGELASGSAVATVLEYVEEATACYRGFNAKQEHAFLDRLEGAVRRAHDKILRDHGAAGRTPATTLTMITLLWPRGYVVHVGDSRAYYLRSGRLEQITRDQTMGEYMVSAGAWTEQQAARARVAGNLTSAVGGPEMTPSVAVVDFESGDVALLCSDGLTKHVADPEIAEVLGSTGSAETMCRELIRRALEAGGTDNVTVVVAKMLE